MTMDPNYFHDVRRFHEKMGIAYDGPPRALPGEVPAEVLDAFANLERVVGRNLNGSLAMGRVAHLVEELREYVEAQARGDLVEALDGLVDLTYVAVGTADFHGFSRFNVAWLRVHGANLAKERVERAAASRRGYAFDVGKPPGWRPPRLDDLVSEELGISPERAKAPG